MNVRGSLEHPSLPPFFCDVFRWRAFSDFFSDPVSWIRMFKHMRLIGLFDGIDEGLVIPDSSTFNETILTDSRGSFNYTFIPEDVGSWSIYASCSGNRNYEGTFSLTISFIVEPFLKPADFRVAI